MSFVQDRSQPNRARYQVRLLAPLIVLVLAATAIPVEFRQFELARLSLVCDALDLVVNLVGYVPVGMALTRLGFSRAVIVAMLLSLVAETGQFFMAHRSPSPIDVALNVAGATIGLLIGRQLKIGVFAIAVNRRSAGLSVLAAVALIGLKAWSDWERLSVNCRGATWPGSLEANWDFDEQVAERVADSSGNGLNGKFRGPSVLAHGIRGMAVRLDGENGYVDFGSPVELRLMGSMTISAWINSTSFPSDDAAIVSAHRPGYQLDTTVDRGRRTIGFKLVDPCGNLMARYGASELARDAWYHVAGVYDADARELNVYLNGRLDNEFLLGSVASAQQESNQRVCVGRRADAEQFDFAGLIDEVRIYSRALLPDEIEKVRDGKTLTSQPSIKAIRALASQVLARRVSRDVARCPRPTSSEDALWPGFMVAMGMLSALACAGFWPGRRLPAMGVSLAVGTLLGLAATVTMLPMHLPWVLPLLSLVGGSSIAVSLTNSN